MTAEIVVMYASEDPNRAGKRLVVRVPLEDVDQLDKTGVLFIIISQLDDVAPRLNGRRRMAEKYGYDRYTLVTKNKWFLLHGFDDGDFKWRRHLGDPFAADATVKPDHLPLVASSVTFEGSQYGESPNSPEWVAAVAQFQEEMH